MSTTKRHRRAAEDVRALIRSFTAVRVQYGLEQIVEASRAAQEIAVWTAEGNDSGAVGEAYMSGLRATIAAEDLLETATEVAALPERAFSLITLVRAALEACSWTYWYLDPAIGTDERAARAVHLADLSLKATRRFFRKAQTAPNEDMLADMRRLLDLVDAHKQRGHEMSSPPNIEGRLRRLVVSLDQPARFADAGLEVLSGVAHVEKQARDLLITGFDASRGEILRSPHPATEWVLWLGGLGYARAADCVIGMLGWESDMWVRSIEHFTTRLTDLVDAVRVERLATGGPDSTETSQQAAEGGSEDRASGG